MKLIGYIRPCKEFSFTIPVYHNGQNFYYHNLDEKFIITGFAKDEIDNSYLIKLSQKINYEIGNKAPIAFIGVNGKLIIGTADKAIIEICKYLDQIYLPKKYIHEELFYYAKIIGFNIKSFQDRFELKYFVFSNQYIIYKDIVKLICTIERYTSNINSKRKRKASFKFQRKSKNVFGISFAPYDIKKIDGFKNYFIDNIIEGNIRKAYHELEKLFDYQIKVSEPKHIAKSFCDISQTLLDIGYISTSKILLYLAKILETNDIVIFTQLAEVLKAEGNIQGAKEMYLEIQNQFPNDIYAKTGLAEVLKAEGNIQGAKEMYLKIQNQFPNDIYAKTGFVSS